MNCHVCDSKESEFLIRLKPIKGHKKLEYFLCKNCGCVYQKEPPSDDVLDLHYRKKCYSALNDILKHSNYKTPVHRWRSGWILDQIKGKEPSIKKMVDLGCGEGSLVKNFLQNKWDAIGIELSDKMVQFAREYNHINVIQEMYNEETFKKNSIGLFTATQVLEHLKYPETVLKNIKNHLAQDGFLYMDVPAYILHNRNELAIDVMQSPHLRLFNLDSFSFFLEKNGFQVIKTIPKMEFIYEHPWIGILARVKNNENKVLPNKCDVLKVKNAVKNAKIRKMFRTVIFIPKKIIQSIIKIILPRKVYENLKKIYNKYS